MKKFLLLFSLLCCLLPQGVIAGGEPTTTTTAVTPAFLRADGTLNLPALAGRNLSLDLKGWTVSIDPKLGPVFAPAASNIGFNALDSGLYGIVKAIAISSTGDVYVGGRIVSVGTGGTAVTGLNNIAKWNGTTWSALDKGLGNSSNGDEVLAIAISGSNVYVGGAFSDVGTDGTAVIGLNNIAKWNGTTWSALDKGVNNRVNAIAINGSNVYAGGDFTDVGTDGSWVPDMNYIAKWNGSEWSALDKGLNNRVYAIAISGSNVYVGGVFTDVGTNGTPVTGLNRIAKWNGTAWSALSTGVYSGAVYAIAISGSDVYVGGDFIQVGSGFTYVPNTNNIAQWNGSSWSALDKGLGNPVNAIAISGSDVYVGGVFTGVYPGGTLVTGLNRIAKWNGTAWSALDKGLKDAYGSNIVSAIASSGADVYVGGYFTTVGTGGTPVTGLNSITRWGEIVATLTLGTVINPSTCSGTDGSIPFTCTGIAAGAATLSYKKDAVSMTTSVTVANGSFTLSGLGIGVYSDFAIGTTTATGSRTLAFDCGAFVTRWDFSTSSSNNNTITFGVGTTGTVNYILQPVGSTYTSSGTFTGSTLTISNLPNGVYDLSILPTNFNRININSTYGEPYLKEIKQWGTTAWTSMQTAFKGCRAMTLTATDTPNTSAVTNMSEMFAGCWDFNQALPADFNTAAVTNMKWMFNGCYTYNQALPANLNTAAVTDMGGMFGGCSAYNQALPANLNTAAVTNMSGMFSSCTVYNKALPANLNTAAVTDMSQMFAGCSAYNQALPANLNTSSVTNMSGMFSGCSVYNQALPANLNTAAVTSMREMFSGCSAYNQPLPANLNTGAVKNMSAMFYYCKAYNQALPTNLNTGEVTDMSSMFEGCEVYNKALPTGFNTAKVTKMSLMFKNCKVYNHPLPANFNTAAVTDMSFMFQSAKAFNESLAGLQLKAGVDLSHILDFSGMKVANYDATLTAFKNSGVTGITMGAVGLYYCAAEADRANLALSVASGGKGWTIVGDAKWCTTGTTLTVGTATNPTTCGGTDGSILFSSTNLAAGSQTLNYKKNNVAATPVTVTVAADGSFTLTGLSKGIYSDFAIGSTTATGARELTDLSLILGTIPTINTGATSFTVPYTATGTPTTYSISGTGIIAVTDAALPASLITVNLSTPASGTSIAFTLTVKNTAACVLAITGSVTVVTPTPTISTTGTLTAFTACSGSTSTQQSFTVSGIALTENITVTAPTGFEVSTTSVFGSSVTLTPSGGSVANTTVFVRMAATATGTPSGNVSCASAGATTQNIAVSGTVNALPTLTLGSITAINTGATSFTLPYTTTGTPTTYSISGTGITAVTDGALPTSPITVNLSTPASGTSIAFTLTVKNAAVCTSTNIVGSVTVNVVPLALGTVTNATTCNGKGSIAFTSTVFTAGSTQTVTYTRNGNSPALTQTITIGNDGSFVLSNLEEGIYSNFAIGAVSASGSREIKLPTSCYFITRWDLSKTGSGATQISFGVGTTGTVNYTWAQVGGTATGSGTFTGSTATITGLPTNGTIDLSISPTNFNRFNMGIGSEINNDRARLMEIKQWGTTAWVSMKEAFFYCINMILTATDVPNTAAVTNMSWMFRNCSSFNQALPEGFNTANVTNMNGMFDNCKAYNQALPASFNTEKVTIMDLMFNRCTVFNKALPPSFNTAAVTSMGGMFFECTNYNQALPPNFNTAAVTNMAYMFYFTRSFNQSLAGLQLNANVNLANFLDNSGLSVANYDATLTAFKNSGITGRTMGAAGLKYCAAEADKDILVKTVANGGLGWTIIDGGKLCPTATTLTLGTAINTSNCTGTPNGSIAFTSTGFTAGSQTLNYKKDNVAATPATVSIAADGSFTLTGLGAGVYSDFAIGSTIATGSKTLVLETTLPQFTLNSNSPQCERSSISINSSLVYPDIEASFTYLWSGPASFSSANANVVISPLQLSNAGTYTLEVTNTATGCKATETITVVVFSLPNIPTITPSAMQLCKDESVLLTGTCSAATDIFRWTTPPLLGNSLTSLTNINQRIITTPGVYKGLCESKDGCLSDEVSVTITEKVNCSPVFISISPSKAAICPGSSVQLTASGCTSGTLTWLGGASPQTGSSITASPTTTTEYTVLCSTGGSGSVTVAVAQPTVAVTNDIVTGQDYIKATQTITSDKKVGYASFTPAPSVRFEAGNSITLLPGFVAEKWSTFSAEIKGCN